MLYTRYYNLELEKELIPEISKFDVFFMGNSSEMRAKKVPSLLKNNFTGKVVVINYDIECEKYSINTNANLDNLYIKENLKETGKDLLQEFIDDLDSIGINNKNILIDITSIKHPILFYFLKLLKQDYKPNTLLLTYTEPEIYKQEVENITKKFDLTEKFCSTKPLPGFLRINDHNKEHLLVALMGFEGNRFSKAFEDINPATRKTYAIVGFPSFQPGWQYYVYSENQYSLEQSKAFSFLNRITANEPFGVYNTLESISKNNKDFTINIAPIGTKPHSLGACMYAIDNEDVQFYYDFPTFGSKKRTIGMGKTFLYNLTEYIKN
ncbi:hypothetical protein [Myroides odoratimimus]|uniref:hypothetical protein n=1 Tax=Myroides odoratimimus TaxID=76832 RepID=UPI002DB7349A|nr:hypothetical protein [Myroides odoratimimus]MEC4084641.1 hypothetical protein [Myroides odoratimimus]